MRLSHDKVPWYELTEIHLPFHPFPSQSPLILSLSISSPQVCRFVAPPFTIPFYFFLISPPLMVVCFICPALSLTPPHPPPYPPSLPCKKRDWPHNINGYLNLRHSCNKTFGGKTLQCLHMLQSVSSWWVVSSILSNVHPPLPLPSFIPKTFPSQNNGFARLHGIW